MTELQNVPWYGDKEGWILLTGLLLAIFGVGSIFIGIYEKSVLIELASGGIAVIGLFILKWKGAI